MSSMEMREHRTAMAIIALFMVFALGAMGIALFSVGESDGSAGADNGAVADNGSGGTPGPENRFDCPRGEPIGFSLSDVEGKTLDEVEAWAEGKGWTVRQVMIDGKPQIITMDYTEDRVNVQTEADVVTRYCGNY